MKLVRRVVRKRWRGEVEVEVAIEKVQQNTAQRQQFEAAYQQTNETITALYDSAPSVEGEGIEITNQNRQVVE